MSETNVVFADVPIRNRDGELSVCEETIHCGDVSMPIVEWRFTLAVHSDNVNPCDVEFRVESVARGHDDGCERAPEFPFRLSGDPPADEAQKRLANVWFDFHENRFRLRPKASAFPGTCKCDVHEYELQIAVRFKEGADVDGEYLHQHAADPHVIFHGGDRWRDGDPDV